jgi:hypothetical protein
VIDLGGGVFERGSNIVRFKVGKVSEYLFFRSTASEHVENVFDYNPVFINDSSTGTRDLVRISLGVLIH